VGCVSISKAVIDAVILGGVLGRESPHLSALPARSLGAGAAFEELLSRGQLEIGGAYRKYLRTAKLQAFGAARCS